jgi:hypothetical protein
MHSQYTYSGAKLEFFGFSQQIWGLHYNKQTFTVKTEKKYKGHILTNLL